jgi:hypothetical protein
VVDSDYRGKIKVLLKNHSQEPITFHTGDRIAQFIFEQHSIHCIQTVEALPPTTREANGFGSTGTATLRYSRFGSSFRLDDNYIIIQNFSNPFRPKARCVHAPIQSQDMSIIPSPLSLPNAEDPHNEELTPIATHGISAKETLPLLPVLDMNTESITIPITSKDTAPTPLTTQVQEASSIPTAVDEDLPTLPNNSTPQNETAITVIPNQATDSNPITPTSPSETIAIHIEDDNLKSCPTIAEHIPPIPVDMVNHALPKRVTMTREGLQRAIGFQNPNLLIKHLHQLGNKETFHLQNMQKVSHIDPGKVASINAMRRNNTPSDRPPKYGDIWHMDIGFGPDTSIGGVRYTLLLVDKFSRYKFIYGLKNLTSSLKEAMQKFLLDCGTKPVLIRTDFDYKLMGGEVAKLLTEEQIQVESAPPYHQSQNRLVERHWQTLVNMARNWLTSSQLPTDYWYFAIKRACEVSNIMPTKVNSKLTTPYELVFQQKVDYRCLIPIFCTSYIKQHRKTGGSHKNKWLNRTLKCILVGKCPKSDSLLFYHPPSKQTLSCSEGYRFDTSTPSGPQFGEHYNGDFFFNTKSALSTVHRPPAHEENATVYFPDEQGAYIEAKVLHVPIKEDSEPYTIQSVISGDIHEYLGEELLDHDLTNVPSNDPDKGAPLFPNMTWIKENAKATLYLPATMPKPQQGRLRLNSETNMWQFWPGRVDRIPPIDLPNFDSIAPSMVHNRKLFDGWLKLSRVLTARRV